MRQFITTILVGLLLCGAASGALETSNVYTDGDGVTWSGATTMSAYDGDHDQTLSAEVEWCVDAPVGGLFKYKYQVSTTGDAGISKFSVGMLESNEAQDIGSALLDAGDIAPSDEFFTGTAPDLDSANWTFPGLVAGDVSYELSYFSVNEPLMFGGSLHNGGIIADGSVASPSDVIPEPMTMALLGVGGLAAVLRRK